MLKKEKISIKDSFRISLWALKLNWQMSPFLTIGEFAVRIYMRLNSLISTYILARVIDTLLKLIESEEKSIEKILPLIFLMGVVQLFTIAASNLGVFINKYRSKLSSSFIFQLEYEKINSLGIQTNQLPEISNKHSLVQDWKWNIPQLNSSLVNLFSSLIQVIISVFIVLSFSPYVAISVLFVGVLLYLLSSHYLHKVFIWSKLDKHTQEIRRSWNLSALLSNPDTMDEVSLVGGFKFLDKKIKDFYEYFNSGYRKILKENSISMFFVDLLNIFVVLGGSIHVFIMAFNKKITIGNTTFFIGSINSFYSGVSNLIMEYVFLSDLLLKMRVVYEFFNLEPVIKDGEKKLERLMTPPYIELKNVSFHYPNSKRDVLKNFSLRIESGEKIAIVGENGAGKSTLVKLLCRVYDPQKGEILINGMNLKDFSINDWYKNVGVLFQDFNFYDSLTVEENIFLGKSIKKIDRKRIIQSAKNADAHDFIKKYKRGYQTVMSERFKGGIKPSKGQQQKIAIARFFYRDAPFAIFDEPTSAIDADAEYRIFNRIYNFFDNKTVMIISHRFSTVRNADRIIVVRDGRIIEEGTHKELIAKDKVYADNFRKQAQGYN